jgi:2-polyprenyl-3-methyl-5-hydroxy-6-metoxy-1,4-benzoquinol methylase
LLDLFEGLRRCPGGFEDLTEMTIAPLSEEELQRTFHLRYELEEELGATPATYKRFGYHSPETYYEALVDRLVSKDTVWLDVGCGRALFPSNPALAQELAERCNCLVGVDPAPTILENSIVHETVQESIYEFRSERKFDLISMRMVAEHIDNPAALLRTLASITHKGSIVVVYTIYSWSPIPLMTRITPFSLRHPLKKFLWFTEEKDTFPTSYLMNTRKQMRQFFENQGFQEAFFSYLDDCRTLSRFQPLLKAELAVWKSLRKASIRYPELCILGAYRRS